MTGVYISLDAILAFLTIGTGLAVGFLGTLSLKEAIFDKEPAALLPATVFGIPGIMLVTAGLRLLSLS